jgi:hypothetical protein
MAHQPKLITADLEAGWVSELRLRLADRPNCEEPKGRRWRLDNHAEGDGTALGKDCVACADQTSIAMAAA